MSGIEAGKMVVVIDSVPDAAGLRLINRLPVELSDAEVAEFAFQRRRAENGSDELPPHLRKLAAYACCWKDDAGFHLVSAAGAEEQILMSKLFAMLGQGMPLTRWSEQEAALDCLRWRSLQAGLPAAQARQALDACECMLSQHGSVPVDLGGFAQLAGLPAVQSASAEDLWGAFQARDWAAIRARAELRALCCWLLQLRSDLVRGALTQAGFEAKAADLRNWLDAQAAEHLKAFAAAWQA